MPKVVVGLSGGVDSSTAAAMLHRQGYEVEGLTLWLMKGKGQCCSEGMVDAAQLCEQLGIPHHVVDSREQFQAQIVDYLVSGYGQGITPLPCSQCNRSVKFGPMLQYAIAQLGIDRIATGHYARVRQDAETGRYQLLRAVDDRKDQSYFLYDLTQDILAHVLFPLGEHTKDETRTFAAQFGLHTADKPESQDLCLVESHGSMSQFLSQYLAPKPGDIVDQAGKVLGQHDGIHNYTIGQRKGLGIAAAQPLYVVGLDVGRNQVIVGDRTSVHHGECTVQRVNWVSMAAPDTPIRAEVQIRYRSPAVPATIAPLSPVPPALQTSSMAGPMAGSDDGADPTSSSTPSPGSGRVRIIFDEPQFGITPGQAAVWYQGDVLLGGGIIEPLTSPSASSGLASTC